VANPLEDGTWLSLGAVTLLTLAGAWREAGPWDEGSFMKAPWTTPRPAPGGRVPSRKDLYLRGDAPRSGRIAVTRRGKTYMAEDSGRPGRRAAGARGPYQPERPWVTRPGKLGGKGFLTKPKREQQRLLDACVEEYGYRSCLGSITALERSTSIQSKYGKTLTRLRDYLRETYGGAGAFGPRKKKSRRKAA
jgi:hypothetical protein